MDTLQGIQPSGHKSSYDAKRPAVVISDIECAQVLYLLIQNFGKDPKRHQLDGEIALLIWLCQHAAYSGLDLNIKDILEIRVTDLDLDNLCITTEIHKIHLTQGLADLLSAWVDPEKRQNQRYLLPSLTYDKLEKRLAKVTRSFFGTDGLLRPSDFLGRVHVIPGARLTVEMRQQLDLQAGQIKSSLYRVDTKEIEKHLRDAFGKNTP